MPYHPKYANEAFAQTIQTFKETYHFEIKLLNWQEFNEDNAQQIITTYATSIDGLLIPGGHYDPDFRLHGADTNDNSLEILFKLSLLSLEPIYTTYLVAHKMNP